MIEVSAKTGAGMDSWLTVLESLRAQSSAETLTETN